MSTGNNKFDVIILSLVVDEHTFGITKACVDSYIDTADDLIETVFVVETNSEFDGSYSQPKVKIIKPNLKFNYNQFYNLALSQCKSEFVIGPNNDVLIQPNCLQTLLQEFNKNSKIQSMSPIDRNWHRHTKMYLPSNNKLYYGYEVSLHVFGCSIACRRSIFQKIGYLDERFFFFYQDNDYSMCAQRCELLHGVHTGANISHMSGGSNRISKGRYQYTPYNMNFQGDIFGNKWYNEEPYKSGGYKKFKTYTL